MIFHSDRGCQYTSRDFAALARANGVVLSVGQRRGMLGQRRRRELLRHHQARAHRHRAWPTSAGLHRAVFDYIEGWYNTRRLHSTLGYLSPARIRSHPPQRRPPGGIINSTNLSVKADQAHYASDDQIRASALGVPFYLNGRPGQKALVLRWLDESFGSKEPVEYDSLTIQHVLPQTVTATWRQALRGDLTGEETVDQVYESLVHTLAT